MHILKRILFPFREKYTELASHWWHRLFFVIFLASVFGILLGVFTSLQQSEMKQYSACYQLSISLGKEAREQGCDVFLPQTVPNLVAAILAALTSNYLLQLIYYL